MKTLLRALITISVAVVLFSSSAHADHHHGGWGWGPVIGLGVGLGIMELARPSYYPGSYYSSPVVIEQAPAVYMPPRTVPLPPQEPEYWYYCQKPQGYYPYITECPQGWMRVVPTPPQPTK